MRKIIFAVLGSLTAALVLACGSAKAPTVSGPGDHPVGAASGATTAAAAAYPEPTVADFEITLTELSRQCFGSAGCNVTFSVNLKNVSGKTLNPARSYRLTFDVEGTSEPYSNYVTITGDQYQRDDSMFAQVKTSKQKLTAKTTGIDPN